MRVSTSYEKLLYSFSKFVDVFTFSFTHLFDLFYHTRSF